MVVAVGWAGVSALILCLQRNATEQEGREKDVKKALALVKQRWSKSKGGGRVLGVMWLSHDSHMML